uniref:Uncharacterized protein n=1 Tax=Oryza sativa subsp. japonica TaxID=39947 RepID=Q8S6L5_ORYSJ|nr:Hypothetical protein [Oryza sativa Japonica Group]
MAQPILAPLDAGFGVDVQDCIPMTVGGHFEQFPFHNHHNYLYMDFTFSLHSHTSSKISLISHKFSLVVSSWWNRNRVEIRSTKVFGRVRPHPALSRGRPASPRLLLLSLRRRPTSSRTSCHDRAPSGCAVATLGLAGASSSPASPPFHGETIGDASSPVNSGVAATASPPAAPSAVPEHRPTSPSPPSTSQRRPFLWLLLCFARKTAASRRQPIRPLASPFGRPFLLALATVGRPFLLALATVGRTSTTFGITAARSSSASPPLHPNPAGLCRRPLIVPGCACCRPSLRQAVLVRRPRPSREPLQPRRRLRPRLRVVKPCAGLVSPSSKDRRQSRSLAVRLRRPRAISAAPIRRRRSHALLRGGKGLSSRCPRPRPFGVARDNCAVVDPGTRVPVSVVVCVCVW